MPSWSFQLEGQVFDGVEIISASHVDMDDKVLDLDPRVCRSVVCLYVYGFKSLWKFLYLDMSWHASDGCSVRF